MCRADSFPLLSLVLLMALVGCDGSSSYRAPAAAPAPPLALTQVLPPEAEIGGGLTVDFIGTGFQGTATPTFVHFGTRVATGTVISDVLIQAVVPPGDAVGAVDVAVVTGSGIAPLAGGFAYLPSRPPTPSLAYLPVCGQSGTRVDLTVVDFAALASPTVTFGGVPGVNLTLLSPTMVRVEVPAGLPLGVAVDIVLTEGPAQVTATGFLSQGTIAAGDLTLNEFLADPGTQDANRDGTVSITGDEFVEVVNRLGVAIDLTGWTIHDSATLRHTFPNPTTVPPGGSIVVFGSGNPTYFAARHATGHALVASTGTLALNNGPDSVILRTPAVVTIAQVNYVLADVTAGTSRNAPVDGQAQPVPAASVDYVLHNTVPGAVGTLSPGTRVNGSAF